MTTYRQLLRDWPGIIVCERDDGCRLRWAAKHLAGDPAHVRGIVDSLGIIHWSGLDKTVRVRGIYQFLRLVALAKHRPWRSEPMWLRLYHTSVWASKQLREIYHRTAFTEWTAADRQRSWRLAHREQLPVYLGLTRTEYLNYLDWASNGLDVMGKRGQRKYLRRPVTKEEIDSWRAMRENGSTYADISRKYTRTTKVIWYHLVRLS